MAKLIAEMATQHAGEILCGELIRRGMEPVALQVVADGHDAIVVLSILGEWTKGLLIPRGQLVPKAVEHELEKWRAKVRTDIARGHPSKPVRQAIERYGREAVDAALKPQTAIA